MSGVFFAMAKKMPMLPFHALKTAEPSFPLDVFRRIFLDYRSMPWINSTNNIWCHESRVDGEAKK
jgi:hypothetical protein